MPLESFIPGLVLKGIAKPVEAPLFALKETEEPPVDPPVEPEEPPIEVYTPMTPYNVETKTYDNIVRVDASWSFDEPLTGIMFIIYVNDVERTRVEGHLNVDIYDLPTGQTYKLTVQAMDMATNTVSAMSEPSYFDMKQPTGITNPNYWIPSKVDNISVSYRK